MQTGDILHILMVDESGEEITIELSNPDDEDGPPSAPIALEETDKTTSSFAANWYFNESTDGYYLDVATDEDFNSMLGGYNNLNVGNVNTYDITGLSEGSIYYYRVRAYNDYGTSDNSNVITANTIFDLAYGVIYNGNATTSVHILPPTGWHIPTEAEWDTLCVSLGGNHLGVDVTAGGYAKEAGTTHWDAPNSGADNSSGLTMVGSGYRDSEGVFGYLKLNAYIAVGGDTSKAIVVSSDNASLLLGVGLTSNDGISVRLMKNDSTLANCTDYDGNTYNAVKIGSQVVTTVNFRCTHYRDGVLIPTITDASIWSADTVGAMCWYYNIEP